MLVWHGVGSWWALPAVGSVTGRLPRSPRGAGGAGAGGACWFWLHSLAGHSPSLNGVPRRGQLVRTISGLGSQLS